MLQVSLGRCSVPGGAIGRTLMVLVPPVVPSVCTAVPVLFPLVPGSAGDAAGKDAAAVMAVPGVRAEGFLRPRRNVLGALQDTLLHGLVLVPSAPWRPQPRAQEVDAAAIVQKGWECRGHCARAGKMRRRPTGSSQGPGPGPGTLQRLGRFVQAQTLSTEDTAGAALRMPTVAAELWERGLCISLG